jgi:hypothetical protein
MKIAMAIILVGLGAYQTRAQSASDTSHQNQSQTTHKTTKKVWTNDDFQSPDNADLAPASGTKATESASSQTADFRRMDPDELGTAVLKMANANVDFPERRDWEQRLFDAKQAWLDQVDRVEGHKDSNQSVQDTENSLARKAQLNFERIAGEGIRQARAMHDPILKAHLEYQRKLDSCQGMSGDLLSTCLYGADAFKHEMQNKGTW